MVSVSATMKLFVESAPLRTKYEDALHKHNKSICSEHPDAGFDLYTPTKINAFSNETTKLDTCVVAACFDANGKPMSYCMYPRSSISKTPLRVANCVGIIDSGYRGHLMGMMDNIRSGDFTIDEYTRYLQLCLPSLEPFRVELVDTIDDLGFTSRGSGGFGSTGK